MKHIRILAGLTTCILLATGLGLTQDHITRVRDSAFAERDRRRPAVPFQHDSHNAAAGIDDCSRCHHVYEDGERLDGYSSEDKECSDCHLPAARKADTKPLVRAYHLLCKDCHLEVRRGPVQCAECHRR
jgi:hypothetical protein